MPFSDDPAAPAPSLPVPRLSARVVTHLCGLFFLSRLLVLAVAALSHLAVEQGPYKINAQTWVGRFTCWDSGWYLSIAADGYQYDPHGSSSVAFYPLYPLLLRAAGYLGLDMRLAGFAISHAALLAACLLLWKLAALETRSEEVAERSVLFLLFCPGAVWFGMIYTESLFLLTLLGCLLCARRNQWVSAGLWGLASALTRTPGLLLAGFLFLEALQQTWEHRRREWFSTGGPIVPPAGESGPEASSWRRKLGRLPWVARVAFGVSGPILGHLSYLVFLQLRFGDWRAQQKTMAAGWKNGTGIMLPWDALAEQWHFNDRHLMVISTALLFLTCVLALAGLFTLKRVGYAALILALCVLYVAATPGDSVTRYLSTAATSYIVLAQFACRSRLLETAALVFSTGAMVLLTILLANGYHVI